MSNFAPRAVFTPHHFEIAENARGYWVAKDKEGLIGGVFRTQKDALRFALFEVAGDSACVRVLSRQLGPDPSGTSPAGPTAAARLELGSGERVRSAAHAADRIPHQSGADALASSLSFSRSLCRGPPFPLENLSADAFLWRAHRAG